MKRILLAFPILLFSFFTIAQELEHEAPTLQVGLNGLGFSPGSLDAKLVMEIVAEKQQEVKLKIVQNMFLEKMGATGGTFYSFADNIVKNIIEEHNPQIRTKKILENAVNLVFVVTFLDYYLRTLDNANNKDNLEKFLEYYTIENPTYTQKGLLGLWKENNTHRREKRVFYDEKNIKAIALLIDMCSDVIKNNEKLEELGLMQTSYSASYDRLNLYLNPKEIKPATTQAIYDDLTKKLNQVVNYIGLANYLTQQYSFLYTELGRRGVTEGISKKLELFGAEKAQLMFQKQNFKYEKEQLESTKNQLINKRDSFKTFKKRRKKKLNKEIREVDDKITLYEKQAQSFQDKIDKINKEIGEGLTKKVSDIEEELKGLKKKLDEQKLKPEEVIATSKKVIGYNGVYFNDNALITGPLNKVADNLKEVIKGLAVKSNTDLLSEENAEMTRLAVNNLIEIQNYLYKTVNLLDGTARASKKEVLSDVVYSLFTWILPEIRQLAWVNAELATQLKTLQGITDDLAMGLIADNPNFINLKKVYPFINLAGKLYEFKDAKTFSDYLAFITMLEDVFPGGHIKDAVATLVSFVKDYTVIETDGNNNEYVSFNVESFLVKLQSIKPNKLRRLGFQFTVGVNHTFFGKNVTITTSDNSLTNVRNFSYVGEKIGVKIKILDREFWMTRNPGEVYKRYKCGNWLIKNTPPKEPVLSNIFLNIYGSGILYNLVNTSTNEEFKLPLVGTGLGFTFFNGLDITFSMGVPIFDNKPFISKLDSYTVNYNNGESMTYRKQLNSFDYAFFNVGFDIQFTEYLDRLNKRRKANKTQKQLAKAVAAQDSKNNQN